MHNLKTAAIIPVKTFTKAKSRLNLSQEKKQRICEIMLESVLKAVTNSPVIQKTVVVSKDETALQMCKRFGAHGICDEQEQSVNGAVLLADDFLIKEDFEASIVFPQDIPLIEKEDIETLYQMHQSKRCVLVVPSRKFDGTNALFRTPADVMETHYDEDSYKIHLDTAAKRNATSSMVLIRRMMLDIDDQSDLELILSNFKNPITESIKKILD